MNAPAEIRPSIIAALATALAKVECAERNADNPHFKKSYADLGSVIAAIRPVAEDGIWYRQVPKRDPDGALIETFYIHNSGEELSAGEMFVPTNKRDPQGFGSAVTYCRRYALQTAFGIATEDDDAEAAMRGAERRDNGGRQGNGDQSRSRQESSQEGGEGANRNTGMPDAEWAKLSSLIQATGVNIGTLIKHYKVENLRLLNQQQYSHALDQLNKRLAEMAKAETDAKAAKEGSQQSGAWGDILDDEIKF